MKKVALRKTSSVCQPEGTANARSLRPACCARGRAEEWVGSSAVLRTGDSAVMERAVNFTPKVMGASGRILSKEGDTFTFWLSLNFLFWNNYWLINFLLHLCKKSGRNTFVGLFYFLILYSAPLSSVPISPPIPVGLWYPNTILFVSVPWIPEALLIFFSPFSHFFSRLGNFYCFILFLSSSLLILCFFPPFCYWVNSLFSTFGYCIFKF